jgi:hypothetical protein
VREFILILTKLSTTQKEKYQNPPALSHVQFKIPKKALNAGTNNQNELN